jgi:uncharacterized protein
MADYTIIEPRSGAGFVLRKGDILKIIDIEGEQVADLMCFNQHDTREFLSSGRTIDYAEKIYLTKGDLFYSNRSNVMFEIIEDEVGKHDFLLTPCSAEMFRKTYGHENPHHGCFGNLCKAFQPYGIQDDQIPVTFNVFMNVPVDAETGKISVQPPLSKAGQSISIEARMDLIVGLTACSAGLSNNFRFKPIGYEIIPQN